MRYLQNGRLAIGALLSCAALATACGSDDEGGSGDGGGEKKTFSVYINSYSQEIPFFANKHAGFEDAGKKLGWKVKSEFGNGTPEQQISQIENALTQQPDAMALTPIDAQALTPVVRQVKEAGIQIIMVGADVAETDLKDSFMGQDNTKLGEDKAKFVVEKLKGQGTVGIVHGIRGLDFSRDQAASYKKVLAAAPGIKVVDGGYAGGFTSDLGLERTQNLLTRNADLDAIIYDQDDIALGGIQAANERDIKPEDIVIVGTDGGDAALERVRKGELDFTVSLCGYALGRQVIDVMEKSLGSDAPPPARVVSKTLPIQTDTIDDVKPGRPDCG